ncbi:MAG: hypothetical protein O7C72_03570, partial [Deltaproteobacteria bacterium]|nr:hypothetical protein [Deltaproteobacteria bacterium]
ERLALGSSVHCPPPKAGFPSLWLGLKSRWKPINAGGGFYLLLNLPPLVKSGRHVNKLESGVLAGSYRPTS